MKNPPSESRTNPVSQEFNPQDTRGTRINGMQQVVELLHHADPAFRESLLKRLGQRDPQLVNQLRKIFG